MNIVYFDKNCDMDELYCISEKLRTSFPNQTFFFFPNSVQLMLDVEPEVLFNIADNVGLALELMKEEKPEEYAKANERRLINIRGKQWKKALNKVNKKQKKKKCVCDECTVIDCPDYDENRKEKCEWFSKNPGGI